MIKFRSIRRIETYDAAWLDSKLDCAAVWLAEYTLLDAARELDCAEDSWADEALAD